MRLALCVLASLLAGFVGGCAYVLHLLRPIAPEVDDIDWLGEYLVTHTPSPAIAGRN